MFPESLKNTIVHKRKFILQTTALHHLIRAAFKLDLKGKSITRDHERVTSRCI